MQVSCGPTAWLGIDRASSKVQLVALVHDRHGGSAARQIPRPTMQRAEPTSPVAPPARAPAEPPREHHGRAPEFYGFVAWSSTSLLFAVYVLWALLPDACIRRLGVKWYPSREWSLLLPAYSTVLVLLTYFVYIALAIAHTPSFSDVSAIVDDKGHLPGPLITPNPYLKHADPTVVPELYDIPIGIVNRVLYGPKINVMHRRSR